MKKRILVSLIALSTNHMSFANDFTPQIDSKKPNVVFILAEDMNPRLGIYGDPNALTPNIDSLAKESVVFTNAFTMAGVSAPSRAGLITGMPQHATGLQHMRTGTYLHPYQAVPPAEVKGYPELLRRAGYFTYVDTKTDYQFSKGPGDIGPFTLWDEHGSYSNLDDLRVPAAWQNHDLQSKPFYINLNPQITHESGIFTRENTPEAFKALPEMWDKLRSHYTLPTIDPKKLKLDPYWLDTPEVREELALFYKNINVMDQQVGHIIKQLKQDGLWDNTIVIFSTDNGDGLPRHKREGYDSGTHVPLIVHVPDKYKPESWKKDGEQDDRLVSFEDLAPTILGFTGTEIPSYMKGKNLSQDNTSKRDYLFSSRGRMDDVNLRSYFVRNADYQYVQNIDKTPNATSIDFRNALISTQQLNAGHKNNTLTPEQESWYATKPAEELYDLKSDPWQLHNIASKETSAEKLVEFREILDSWRNETNDMSIIPEAQMVKDLQTDKGETHITKTPVIEVNSVTGKIHIASRTEGASIGYRFDNGPWQIYVGALTVPADVKSLEAKAVRYGWNESEVQAISVNL